MRKEVPFSRQKGTGLGTLFYQLPTIKRLVQNMEHPSQLHEEDEVPSRDPNTYPFPATNISHQRITFELVCPTLPAPSFISGTGQQVQAFG